MREQVARLTKLTADLLDLSKLDADVLQVNAERVDLGELARRIAEEFGPAAERHGSPIEINGDGVAVALADADRVAQIMRILVDNALTHTPEGTSISIEAQRRDGAASLVVRDDGPGIDPHARGTSLRPLLHGRPRERLRARPGDRSRAGPADGRRAGARIAPGAHRVHPAPAGAVAEGARREPQARERSARCSRLRRWRSGRAAGTTPTRAGSETPVASTGNRQKTVVVQSRSGAFDPEAIYQEAAPGVVTIRSISAGGPSLLGGGGSAAQGSGFVISDDGEIATNAHVVTDAQRRGGPIHEAKEVYVQFADRNQVAADIVGFDPHADVALLKVDPDGLDLHPLGLATREEVQVGQPVAAIGSPFGEDRSLSVGVVSATDRSIQSLTAFQIEGAIQTDAWINPGNSGGPLLDAEGNVIGINQQINTTSGGNEGVGFAVPIALVARSIDQLREDGSVEYAYIGVTTQSLYPQLADRLGTEGRHRRAGDQGP